MEQNKEPEKTTPSARDAYLAELLTSVWDVEAATKQIQQDIAQSLGDLDKFNKNLNANTSELSDNILKTLRESTTTIRHFLTESLTLLSEDYVTKITKYTGSLGNALITAAREDSAEVTANAIKEITGVQY